MTCLFFYSEKPFFPFMLFPILLYYQSIFFLWHPIQIVYFEKKKSMLGPGSVQKITTFLNEFLKKKFTVKIDQLVLIFDNFNYQMLEFF